MTFHYDSTKVQTPTKCSCNNWSRTWLQSINSWAAISLCKWQMRRSNNTKLALIAMCARKHIPARTTSVGITTTSRGNFTNQHAIGETKWEIGNYQSHTQHNICTTGNYQHNISTRTKRSLIANIRFVLRMLQEVPKNHHNISTVSFWHQGKMFFNSQHKVYTTYASRGS